MNPNEENTAHPANSHSQPLAMAYLKPVHTTQGVGFAVCTADGSQLAVFPSREAAYFAAKQHDLEPMLLH